MKSFFALAVAATALATVNAVDCDASKLVPLLQDADVKKCGADTGLQPPIPPTADVLPKLCGNTACQAALAKLKGVLNGDCTIAGIALESQFIAPIEKYCASASPSPATTAPAPATSPSPTTAAPKTPSPSSVAPTPASNSPTTTSPSTTTPSTSKPATGGSGNDTTIEENPIDIGSNSGSLNSTVSNSTTPTPTPTSGASSVAFAASAVVLAVAAAFM